MQAFQAAAIQMVAGSDLDANLDRAADLVSRAKAQGARLIALPEVFAWRGNRSDEASAACPVPGRVSAFLSALAADLRVVLIGGSFLEQIAGNGKAYNTSLVFDADGSLRGCYRKIHLFDVDLPGRVTVCESETRAPGGDVVTAATSLGVIGLSVCYDLRFPELYRALVRAGAIVLAIPAAFTAHTGAAHWEPLVRARAIENQTYVIAPNQTGVGPTGIRDYGHSLIVDPWGTVLADAGEGEAIVTAEIDPARIAQVREEMPCLRHARLLH
jgi:predicted amidohydrolase